MKEIKLHEWKDSMLWCPSQCYYYFKDKEGNTKCIYLRWRHNDPWTAEIVPIDEEGDFGPCEQWESLKPPFFKDEEIDLLKAWCLKAIENKY